MALQAISQIGCRPAVQYCEGIVLPSSILMGRLLNATSAGRPRQFHLPTPLEPLLACLIHSSASSVPRLFMTFAEPHRFGFMWWLPVGATFTWNRLGKVTATGPERQFLLKSEISDSSCSSPSDLKIIVRYQ